MSSKRASRFGSAKDADCSGGKLPPIPMSKALADILAASAEANFRSPRDHALLILRWFFGLAKVHPTHCSEEMDRIGQPTEAELSIDMVDLNRALTEIERLSESDEKERE